MSTVLSHKVIGIIVSFIPKLRMKTALAIGGSFGYWHLYWFYQRYNVYNQSGDIAMIRTIDSHDRARKLRKNKYIEYRCYFRKLPMYRVLRFYKDDNEIAAICYVNYQSVTLIDYHLSHENNLIRSLCGMQ